MRAQVAKALRRYVESTGASVVGGPQYAKALCRKLRKQYLWAQRMGRLPHQKGPGR